MRRNMFRLLATSEDNQFYRRIIGNVNSYDGLALSEWGVNVFTPNEMVNFVRSYVSLFPEITLTGRKKFGPVEGDENTRPVSLRVWSQRPKIDSDSHPDWSNNYNIALLLTDSNQGEVDRTITQLLGKPTEVLSIRPGGLTEIWDISKCLSPADQP